MGVWRGTTVALERHVVDAGVDAAQLDILQLLLKKLQIAAAISYLRIDAGSYCLIVRLRTHDVGSIDEGLFALDLLLDVLDGLVVIHGGERFGAIRSRETLK